MQYTIKKIQGSIVTVDFENGSWAEFSLNNTWLPYQIDELVGTFTTEYKIDETPNPNITVGETRSTISPEEAEEIRLQMVADNPLSTPEVPDSYYVDWGTSKDLIGKLDAFIIAHFLKDEGDCRMYDAIKARYESELADLSVDEFLTLFNSNNDTY